MKSCILFFLFGVLSVLSGKPGLPIGADEFSAGFTVFEAGKSGVVMEVPAGASDELREAVTEFQKRVQEMGGVRIPAVSPAERAQNVIRFAHRKFTDSLLFPPGMDDRFRILSTREALIIEADDPVGWEFGLYTLLDEFGGVRWFWPGEWGTYTPQRDRWKVPHGVYEYEPAYVSRRLWRVPQSWARRNRLKEQYSYNHNLRTIFTRKFFLEHPEALAVDWDPQEPPGPRNQHFWRSQPDLSEEVVVEAAAEAAIRFFRNNPGRSSFSLSPNDNTRFGDSAGIREWTRPMRYFRDLPDYSDLHFQFMNRVAAIVSKVFPDRFLATHAYMWWENVPRFPVHPMVLPYLTADRSQGHDVTFSEGDRDLVRKWTQAGPRVVGIYEYAHGVPHPFPRRANLLIGQRIRDAHAAGVRAYFSEISPIWPLHGEVPWMIARMLWNPDLKPGDLENEFREKFFGAAAAPFIKEFYDRARAVWMRQEGRAVWIKYYRDEAGIELFSEEDLDSMTQALEEALQVVEGEKERKRVEALRSAWELSLVAARLQEARKALVWTQPGEAQLAPVYRFLSARNRWENVVQGLAAEPLTSLAGGTRFPQSDPSYHALRMLLEELPEESVGPVVNQLQLEATRLRDEAARIIFSLAERATVGSDMQSLVDGPVAAKLGTMQSTGPEPWEIAVEPPWELRVSPSARVSVDIVERGGREVLRIRDAYAAGLLYHFDVPAKSETARPLAYEGTVEMAAKVSPGNRTLVEFRWWDAEDRNLGMTRGIRVPIADEAVEGVFRTFGYPPEGAVRGALTVSTVRQEEGDWLEIDSVSMDSFQ